MPSRLKLIDWGEVYGSAAILILSMIALVTVVIVAARAINLMQ